MNAPQENKDETYPQSLLLGLGIVSVLYGLFDFYLMATIRIYGEFFTGWRKILWYFLSPNYQQMVQPRLGLFVTQLILETVLMGLLIAYIGNWIRHLFSKKSEITHKLISEGTTRQEDLSLRNFLTYRKNGIAFYQLLTLSILMIHFLGGQIYMMRESFAFDRFGFDQYWGYIMPAVTGMTLLMLGLGLIFMKDKISLNSLAYLLDRILIFLLFMAYVTLSFTDTEGFYLTGTMLTFPLLFLAVYKINKPTRFYIKDMVQVDENGDMNVLEEEEGTLPKWIILAFGTNIIMILYAFIGYISEVSDYNMFNRGDQINFINIYGIVYLGLMVATFFAAIKILENDRLERVELIYKRAFVIIGLLFLSIFVYDDLYFDIGDFGERINILFLATFLLVQLPVAFLTGISVVFANKYTQEGSSKKNSKPSSNKTEIEVTRKSH